MSAPCMLGCRSAGSRITMRLQQLGRRTVQRSLRYGRVRYRQPRRRVGTPHLSVNLAGPHHRCTGCAPCAGQHANHNCHSQLQSNFWAINAGAQRRKRLAGPRRTAVWL